MPPKKKDPFAFDNGSPKRRNSTPRARKTPKSGIDYASFYRENFNAVKCQMPFLPKSQLNSLVRKAFADRKKEEKQTTPVSNSQRKRAYTQYLKTVDSEVVVPFNDSTGSRAAMITDEQPYDPMNVTTDEENSNSSMEKVKTENVPLSPVAHRTRKRLSFSPDKIVFTSKPQAI